MNKLEIVHLGGCIRRKNSCCIMCQKLLIIHIYTVSKEIGDVENLFLMLHLKLLLLKKSVNKTSSETVMIEQLTEV